MEDIDNEEIFNELRPEYKEIFNNNLNMFQKKVCMDTLKMDKIAREKDPENEYAGVKTAYHIDRGEGKTRTSLLTAMMMSPDRPILIVTSLTVQSSWIDELELLFGDSARYYVYKGSSSNKNNYQRIMYEMAGYHIVLTTNESLRLYYNQNDPENEQMNDLIYGDISTRLRESDGERGDDGDFININDAIEENQIELDRLKQVMSNLMPFEQYNNIDNRIRTLTTHIGQANNMLTTNSTLSQQQMQEIQNDIKNMNDELLYLNSQIKDQITTNERIANVDKIKVLEKKIARDKKAFELQFSINEEKENIIPRLPKSSINSTTKFYNRHPKVTTGFGPIFSTLWGCLIVDEFNGPSSLNSNIGQGLLMVPAKRKLALSGTLLSGAKEEDILAFHLFIEDEDFPNNLPMAKVFVTDKRNDTFLVPGLDSNEYVDEMLRRADELKTIREDIYKLETQEEENVVTRRSLKDLIVLEDSYIKKLSKDRKIVDKLVTAEHDMYMIEMKVGKTDYDYRVMEQKRRVIIETRAKININDRVKYKGNHYMGYGRKTIYKKPRSLEERGIKEPHEEIVVVNFSREEKVIYTTLKETMKKISEDIKTLPEDETGERVRLRGQNKGLMTTLQQCLVSPKIALANIALDAISSSRPEVPRFFMNRLDEMNIRDYMEDPGTALSQRVLKTMQLANRHNKVVIFSKFRTTIKLIMERMGGYRKIFTFDPSVTKKTEERRQLINTCRSLDENILFLTYNIGCEGLNLQYANAVILMDYEWSDADTKQAIGRVLRQGQLKKVYIYYMLSNTFFEHRIIEKHLTKKKKTEELSAGVSSTKISKISIDEVMRILNDEDNEDMVYLMGKLKLSHKMD